MAAVDGVVTLTDTPWRNVDVEVYPANVVDAARKLSKAPYGDPVLVTPAAATGSVEFEAPVASLTVGADDAAVTFTALTGGDAGNDITITFTDPAGNDQAIDVTVAADAIDVSLATGPAGAITSTADDIVTAIAADDPGAADLVVAVAGGDGSGVVEAAAETNLAGGYDALTAGSYVAVAQDPAGAYQFAHFQVVAS